MNPFTVTRVLRRRDQLRSRFTPWHTHWQRIAEWIFTRKASFTMTVSEGEFLDRDMFDMTGPMALDVSSSAFIGMLWPNAAESFDIVPGDDLKDDPEAQDYFAKVTEIMVEAMDDPAAGLASALSEYGKELMAFGNGAVCVEPGTQESKLRFSSRSLQGLLFDEGTPGRIDVIFDHLPYTVEQAVRMYGLASVHENVRKAYNRGQFEDRLELMHAVMPRPEEMRTSPAKASKQNMPYISLHIDVGNKHIMREDGFYEPPLIVGRMERYAKEVPGRGPGSRALPEIVKANNMAEAITLAAEKKLDPAMYVYSDMRNTVIDTSPGAVNVFRPKGQVANNAPAGTLFDVGSMSEAVQLYEMTQGNIKQHFYLDRLLDLNSDRQMTAYETFERKIIRSQTLKDPATRQYGEFYTPLLIRTFNLLWRGGHLGSMPGAPDYEATLAAGGFTVPAQVAEMHQRGNFNAWKIRYKTPAMREMKLQSVQNNMQFINYTALAAQALQNQELLSLPDGQEILRNVAEGLGVIPKGVRTRKAIKDGQAQAAASAQQQQALAMAAQAGEQLGPTGKILENATRQTA
ncbi:Head-to-tail connector protein, podovirus-type [uncultured Caudovirales phage]|uniref:Head-to-tail connector protein, podovirus-type n=1 Tax=uncultured Caudovirales phage TaxID=2100421 RepID=A0A6J5LV89_9CAUD|nr:Head-to-tail connector protein, podovirus-type [uncultured Caudovirales phage]